MTGRFEGKVLLATGGGSGLAAAVARRFTREGGRVALLDMRGDAARAVAAELPGAIALEVDVASEEGMRDAVAQVHQHFGRIDCAFCAAGHADFDPIEKWTLERWNRMMAVHLGGTFLVVKNVLPIMRAQGGGSIVNVASIAALTAQPNNSVYGAAKAGIIGFTQQLAQEAAPSVRVNVVAPGRIRTGMTVPLWTQRAGGDPAKGAEQAAALNMLKRTGEPDDIAGPVCFLFSDDAAFMTGKTLVPDGGEVHMSVSMVTPPAAAS